MNQSRNNPLCAALFGFVLGVVVVKLIERCRDSGCCCCDDECCCDDDCCCDQGEDGEGDLSGDGAAAQEAGSSVE